MNMIAPSVFAPDHSFPGTMTGTKQGIVVVVSDNADTIEKLAPVCDFLELKMEIVSAGTDLMSVLRIQQPVAVISDVEGEEQDGFYNMMVIARHSRDLPVMLLTGGDPVLMGAADAVQDLCGLTAVTRTSEFPVAGQLVAFLFTAGRQAGCMRLVPV